MKEGIEAAAIIGTLGLDPLRFLYTRNELERDLMQQVAKRMARLREIERHNQAVEIANQVGKLFSKK